MGFSLTSCSGQSVIFGKKTYHVERTRKLEKEEVEQLKNKGEKKIVKNSLSSSVFRTRVLNTFLSLMKGLCSKRWNSLRSVTAVLNLLTFHLIYLCLRSILFLFHCFFQRADFSIILLLTPTFNL